MIFVLLLVALPCFLGSPPADVDVNAWWGPKELEGKADTSIRQFKIKFEKEVIADLRYRLKHHRKLTPPLKGAAFSYGFNTNQLEAWVNFWAEQYPFSEREIFFNTYPHYKTNIQGLDIHFMRIVPEVPPGVEIIPVLMSHGWAGSFREFYEAIPHLTAVSAERNFAIELIVPSLPGFGFSQGTEKLGMGSREIAVILRNLMHRIGHKKYVVQGGDFGSVCVGYLSVLFPEEVILLHTNFAYNFFPVRDLISSINSTWSPTVQITKEFLDIVDTTGYLHEQATRPDTVGVGLADSPTGFLAYLLELISSCTNRDYRYRDDGGLLEEFTDVQLIDNIMIYWINNCITTSMRIYAETLNIKAMSSIEFIPVTVPTWILQAPHEVLNFPLEVLKQKYHNIKNATYLEKGGHFLAFTYPKEFSADVIKAITEFRTLASDSQN